MYAADGTFLTYLARENSEPVSLDDIPQPVIDAVLAMEDADFYQHDGVNYRAIFRQRWSRTSMPAASSGAVRPSPSSS
ncbi:MAG: transglycosylase domain-containing protein [Acidimicrobiales bacterium]